jgi:hypothetical protein
MSYSRWGGSAWYAFYNVSECLSLWYDMAHTIDHTYDECLDLTVSKIMEIYGCTEAEALEAMNYVRNFIEDKV